MRSMFLKLGQEVYVDVTDNLHYLSIEYHSGQWSFTFTGSFTVLYE